jgi:hypothetical protein
MLLWELFAAELPQILEIQATNHWIQHIW